MGTSDTTREPADSPARDLPARDDVLTTAEQILALPEDSILDTGRFRRTRTHEADEWDFVLDSADVLHEGGGQVTVVYLPSSA